MQPRRPTRQIVLGDERTGLVRVGGDAPVSVQTMTAGYTHEIDKCVAEIHKLTAAGADVVRVAVPEKKDTEALAEILGTENADGVLANRVQYYEEYGVGTVAGSRVLSALRMGTTRSGTTGATCS
mgnify:CR=1 FL=1